MKSFTRPLRYALLSILAVLAVSCGSQPNVPNIPGVQGPFFNVQDGKVLISLNIEKLDLMMGGRYPLTKLPNSFVELSPAQMGGTFMQVALALEDIEGTDWSLVDPTALPGGRPLPGVVGGRLPAIAVNIPSAKDTTFYVSKQIFGFFLPFKVDVTDAVLTFRIFMDDKHIGNVSLVGNDQSGDNSGMLLLMNLDKNAKARLQTLIKHSKKKSNRGKLF
jgi:hypothetical protein